MAEEQSSSAHGRAMHRAAPDRVRRSPSPPGKHAGGRVLHVRCRYTLSLAGSSALQLEARIEAMVGQFSEGRGGGFFFFSPDSRYVNAACE